MTFHKTNKSWKAVQDILDILKAICTVAPMSVATHEKACAIAGRAGYSIDDSLVLAGARWCSLLWSLPIAARRQRGIPLHGVALPQTAARMLNS